MAEKYTLPDLPYDYNALEPHIDAQTMEIHHSKHHQTYVDKANAALEALEKARANDDASLVQHYVRDHAFNLGGHLNHSIFWKNMSPDGGGDASGAIGDQINQDFGSFEAFKAQFTANATAVQGSGWGWLAWDPAAKSLILTTVEKQHDFAPPGVFPLLGIDVWEHAYYLKYQNARPKYIEAWWNVVNWDDVSKRLERARGF
jgi:superoxide dismutase, Fe-Mn family